MTGVWNKIVVGVGGEDRTDVRVESRRGCRTEVYNNYRSRCRFGVGGLNWERTTMWGWGRSRVAVGNQGKT